MRSITKKEVEAQWESYYAAAVLQMQQDGLFLDQVKSHTNGKDKILRVHPAFGVFEKAADALAKINGWQKEQSNQLALEL
jgi:hypothetical protein